MFYDTTHGALCYDRMQKKIKELFPKLTDGQVTYVCNKIGNFIRSQHCDMYDITLSDVPLYGISTAEITFEVAVADVVLYLWAATD